MAQTCAGRTAVGLKPDDRLPPYVQALKDAGIGRIVVVVCAAGQDYQRFFLIKFPDGGEFGVISCRAQSAAGVALKRGMAWLMDSPDQDIIVTAETAMDENNAEDVLRMAQDPARPPFRAAPGQSFQEHVPKSRMATASPRWCSLLIDAAGYADGLVGSGFHRDLLARHDRRARVIYEYEMNVLIECAAMKVPMRPAHRNRV